jgi:hypothetical protein
MSMLEIESFLYLSTDEKINLFFVSTYISATRLTLDNLDSQ